jgi:YidC/Oxa1 family membrane protein insertase
MLLAIVLSFLIFFVYQSLFVDKTQKHEVQPVKEAPVADQQISGDEEKVKVITEPAPPIQEDMSEQKQRPGRTIHVSTPLYKAEFSEGAGAFRAFRLKNYREALAKDAPMKELFKLSSRAGTTPVVSFTGSGVNAMGSANFRTAYPSETLEVSQEKTDLAFSWNSLQGVAIVKTYVFHPDSYEVDLEVNVRNVSPDPIQDNLTVTLRNNVAQAKNSRYTFQGPAALIDGELEEIGLDDIEDDGNQTGVLSWIAFEDQYFASGLIPENPEKASLRLALRPNDILDTTYVDPAGPVAPQTERTYRYKLYFGPKSLEGLKAVGSGFDKILDFGFFDIIAKPFLFIMNAVYSIIPNYGVAIIAITILVKLLFWPLSNKSYQSMSQMKRLQPKMAEIRKKYKNDKKMMNQELMNLYKIYKVNPLGGCLPMVLQIPVFFAFYKMLLQSIELRHAPFLLWINDLSAPDRLFDFGVKVPLMAPPYGIPVLTLVMGASMFFQQKMSPPPGDPAQAKMMMFMPIFFTFIFINFPSGLVLYWLVNNILSMAQQYYVSKKKA